MKTINQQQIIFITHLLKRRAFGWQEPDILVSDVLAPYSKKELETLTEDEFCEIISSSLFWEFCNLESYEEDYEEGEL